MPSNSGGHRFWRTAPCFDFSISQNDSLRFQLTEGDGSEPQLYLAGHRPISLETVDFTHTDQAEPGRMDWHADPCSVQAVSFTSVSLYSACHVRRKKFGFIQISPYYHGRHLAQPARQPAHWHLPKDHAGRGFNWTSQAFLSQLHGKNSNTYSLPVFKDRSFWLKHTEPFRNTFTGGTNLSSSKALRLPEILSLFLLLRTIYPAFCKENNISIISLFMASLYICISRLTAKRILPSALITEPGLQARKDMLGMFVSTADQEWRQIRCGFLSFVHSVGKEQLSVMRHQKYQQSFVNELRQIHDENDIGISMQYQPLGGVRQTVSIMKRPCFSAGIRQMSCPF